MVSRLFSLSLAELLHSFHFQVLFLSLLSAGEDDNIISFGKGKVKS